MDMAASGGATPGSNPDGAGIAMFGGLDRDRARSGYQMSWGGQGKVMDNPKFGSLPSTAMSCSLRHLRRGLPVLVALLWLAGLAPAARAQWVENGLRLAGLGWQLDPHLISDGIGGAFVLLRDLSSPSTDEDARLLHLTSNGLPASGWAGGGLVVDQTATWEWWGPGLLQQDGTATVTYRRGGLPCTGRFRQDGTVVPGWGPGTLPLSTTVTASFMGRPCPTPDNGNFFIWQVDSVFDRIRVQRFDASGQLAPNWPGVGVTVAGDASWDYLYLGGGLVPVDGDGAWFSYYAGPPSNPPSSQADVFVQHLDGVGNPRPGFPYGGINVCSAPGVQAQPALCRDGGNGVFVAWCDARSCPGMPDPDLQYCYDIYLQRLTGAGTPAPGWPANGLPVCVDPDVQQAPQVVPDGLGGVFVAWEIAGPQGPSLYAQHVLADGSLAPGWPVGGKRMFSADAYADNMAVASDQLGGLFVAGSLYLPVGGFRVYVQHVSADGQFDGAWGAAGLPMVSPLLNQSEDDAELAESLPGSVIVAWNDSRSGTKEAYAARVTLDGVVATTVSLVAQEASAGRVALAWSAGGDAPGSATVERRGEDTAWRSLASIAPDGSGLLRYEDRDVVPGARYGYRLVWTEAAGPRQSAEAWVTVPLADRFALAGATPNPAPRAALRVAYSLAERGAATLALYDAQGRAVARRAVAGADPGPHVEGFPEAGTLRPGLYWLRLAQGERHATTRVVLVD